MTLMKAHSILFQMLLFATVPLLIALACSTAAARSASLDETDPTHQSYLPFVARQPPPVPTSEPTCSPNEQEQQIASLMMDDPGQQRPSLTCHPILAQVARERAQDMADRGYFSHTNPDGYGPNYLVAQAGYVLPSYYHTAPDANNIESIAGGYPTARMAWDGWMGSPGHRTHLLGEVPFFAEQVEYGIGYASGGAFGHYWVVITPQPGPKGAAQPVG